MNLRWTKDFNGEKCVYMTKEKIIIRLYTKKEVLKAIEKGWNII